MSRRIDDIRVCPVCNTGNPMLNVTCISCGGYIQDRVASLHLFQTLWMLIESPTKAMQRIIVAQQKNYVFPLQMIFGLAYVAFVFWYANIGLLIDDLQVLLVLVLILGPFTGIVIIMLLSLVAFVSLQIRKIAVIYRDVRAVVSYAGFPVIVSVLFIFPAEVGIFGIYLFTNEPSPFAINPVVWGIIVGLDALLVVWSIVLLYIGIRLLTGISVTAVLITILIIIAALLPVIAIASIVSVYQGIV